MDRPATNLNGPGSHVLIIAAHETTRRDLELSLPDAIPRRSVATVPETEGIVSQVIVLAGDFPLVELGQVRAHPRLQDIPVVLFAPGQDLPVIDWPSVSVWPVIIEHNALGQLVGHIRRLLALTGCAPTGA